MRQGHNVTRILFSLLCASWGTVSSAAERAAMAPTEAVYNEHRLRLMRHRFAVALGRLAERRLIQTDLPRALVYPVYSDLDDVVIHGLRWLYPSFEQPQARGALGTTCGAAGVLAALVAHEAHRLGRRPGPWLGLSAASLGSAGLLVKTPLNEPNEQQTRKFYRELLPEVSHTIADYWSDVFDLSVDERAELYQTIHQDLTYQVLTFLRQRANPAEYGLIHPRPGFVGAFNSKTPFVVYLDDLETRVITAPMRRRLRERAQLWPGEDFEFTKLPMPLRVTDPREQASLRALDQRLERAAASALQQAQSEVTSEALQAALAGLAEELTLLRRMLR